MGFQQEGWVVNTLVEIGVPLIDILDVYDQVCCLKNPLE